MTEESRLVDVRGQPDGETFVLHLTTRSTSDRRDRRYQRIVVDELETARDLLSEVSRMRGWISQTWEPNDETPEKEGSST